jgi:hypothetical protein
MRPNSARKQVRNFVMIWVVITVLMGACTFAAIYTAYGVLDGDAVFGVAIAPTDLPTESNTVNTANSAFATQDFPTRLPTDPVTATFAPTSTTASEDVAVQPTNTEIIVQAQAATEVPTEPPPPTIAPTPLPVNDKEFQLGIQVQVNLEGQQELWMGEVDKLGMEWVKQQVRWELIEPEEDQYDWTQLDVGFESAADHGFKMLASVVTAPDWSREPGVNLAEHGPPADMQDYADFLTKMIERYPGKIHAIEVWNEQNLDREWTSTRGLQPSHYIEMLRISYQTIKSLDPGIIVISGALSPTGFDNRINAWDDFAYMDAMIANGLLNYTDCVGAHHNGINVSPAYTWDAVPNDPTAQFRGPFDNPHHSWSFRSTLQGYAFRVEQAGGDQKLCVTEFGWASTEDLGVTRPGFEFAADNTLEEQAEWTILAINNMIEWDIVQIATLWNLNYGPQAGWNPENDNVAYSIIGKDWNFRPVYGALQEWTANYHRGPTK